MNFEILDISGDIGIRAAGITCKYAFVNTAMGMYSLITDLAHIRGKKDIKIEIESSSLEGLLVAYLNELIFHFDTYGFIGKKIEIFDLQPVPPDCRLTSTIHGEEFDARRHEKRLLIKAATYHNIKVEKVNGEWKTEVVFDI